MNPILRVSHGGTTIFASTIAEVSARVITLFAWTIPKHLASFPSDTSTVMALLSLRIEDALLHDPNNWRLWKDLCTLPNNIPLEVELIGNLAAPGSCASADLLGGDGGSGAWPGGGGGGGGSGGASGGPGADGAIAYLCYSENWQLVDIELFVTPGTGEWISPKGVAFVTMMLMGGGGGGGGSTSQLPQSLPIQGMAISE